MVYISTAQIKSFATLTVLSAWGFGHANLPQQAEKDAQASQGSVGTFTEPCVWQPNTGPFLLLCHLKSKLVLHQYFGNKMIFTYQVHSKWQEIIIYCQKPIYSNLILLCPENPHIKMPKNLRSIHTWSHNILLFFSCDINFFPVFGFTIHFVPVHSMIK